MVRSILNMVYNGLIMVNKGESPTIILVKQLLHGGISMGTMVKK